MTEPTREKLAAQANDAAAPGTPLTATVSKPTITPPPETTWQKHGPGVLVGVAIGVACTVVGGVILQLITNRWLTPAEKESINAVLERQPKPTAFRVVGWQDNDRKILVLAATNAGAECVLDYIESSFKGERRDTSPRGNWATNTEREIHARPIDGQSHQLTVSFDYHDSAGDQQRQTFLVGLVGQLGTPGPANWKRVEASFTKARSAAR